jgi:hypothetical protein
LGEAPPRAALADAPAAPAAAAKDRQLVALRAAPHCDLCDTPDPTGGALKNAVPFLRKHLDVSGVVQEDGRQGAGAAR